MANEKTSPIPESEVINHDLEGAKSAAQEDSEAQQSGDTSNTSLESTTSVTDNPTTELPQSEKNSPSENTGDHEVLESDNLPSESTIQTDGESQASKPPQAIEERQPSEVPQADFQLPIEVSLPSPTEVPSTLGGEERQLPPAPVSPSEELLQELLSKVGSLESKLENLPEVIQTQFQQLENRLTVNQDEAVEAAGAKPMQKLEKIIQIAYERDQASRSEDEQEMKDYDTQVHSWAERIKTLRQGIVAATQECYDRIKECGKVMKEFQHSCPNLYDQLQGRHEGLELIERMLVRLQKPAEALSDDQIPDKQLPSISEQELIALLESQRNEETARQLIDNKLEELGNQRYKYVRQRRDIAEGLSKGWLNFVEKKVLPILDGIDTGEQVSQSLVNKLKEENQPQQEKLDFWFQTYKDLRKMLLNTLEKVEVQHMEVKTGVLIDYNRQEPFDVQPDPNLPNEYIKEVTRHGYEYKDASGSEFKVLRNAQVVVVKNKN